MACASVHHQIDQISSSLDGDFNIYPLVPPCTFNLKIDLIKYYLDKSVSKNDITILAYGLCHPRIKELLMSYGEEVVRLKGSNCYEMFLGTAQYKTYHKKAFWILNKPFLTKFKKDLLSGFDLKTKNGRMLIEDSYKKLLYLDFKDDPLDKEFIKKFADQVYLDYEIHPTDLSNLRHLLEEAIKSATPCRSPSSSKTHMETPPISEIKRILEELDEIIYKIDINSRKVTYINPQVEFMLGYTPEEFMKILNEELQVPIYHPEDRNYVLAKRYKFILDCLNLSIKEVFRIEYRMKHKNGETMWVEEKLFPILNKDGRITSFVGKIADITKQKALNRTEFYKDLLLHDIKNIFNNIKSSLHLFKVWKEDANKSEKREEMIRIIDEQLERGTSFISNVRKLSEIDAQDQIIKSVNIKTMVQNEIKYFQSRFQEKSLEINTEIPSEIPKVVGGDLLEDVFENILINGYLHNEKEKVRMWVYLSKIKKNGKGYVKIEIMDNGVGIPEERKKQIFERKKIITKNKSGMGIGLSLVQKIVASYGGEISVQNRVKGDYTRGSNFVLLLRES
ncbi:MAG: hypothetical protein BAJALOKI2v1_150054 [Promethearchaeota archaeon]|nr:MAG: hypothetical protein BAJALOKI2v1_150054 [Candidatus Lokiarchaeota archaeon]